VSNSSKVNIAMIGCGQIAKAHLKSIENIPNAELVAVMDVVEEKARSMADQYNAKLYTSIEDVLDDNSVDAVVLPLPHHLHCPVTIQAAKAGKHILVEKDQFTNQMREFVGSIIAGRQPRPSGSDVLPTIAVLDAAKESSLTNRLIRIGVP
jgi:predicted dehydrogenase